MKVVFSYLRHSKKHVPLFVSKAGMILVAIIILFTQCNRADLPKPENASSKKKGINHKGMFPPNWAYSQAIEAGNFIFTSGQPAWDMNHQYVSYDIREQAHQVFKHLKTTLEAAGSSLDDVVQVQGYLKRGEYYKVYDEVWQEYFHEPYPARITVFDDFGDSTLIELSVIAYKGAGQNK